MRKAILLCGLLLVAATGSASAAGVSLHWNDCTSGGGVQNLNFACDDDLASFSATGQFRMPAPLNGVTGIELSLDLATAGPTLPAWWQFNEGQCRATNLSLNADTTGKVGCPDWAGGTALGGLATYTEGSSSPNTAHILGGFAVGPPRNLTDLTQNFFAFNLVILADNTTAGGSKGVACGGCDLAACIVFNQINVVTPFPLPLFEVKISNSELPGGNFITWQGGAGVNSSLGQGCPAATPTRKSTWGELKSLYR